MNNSPERAKRADILCKTIRWKLQVAIQEVITEHEAELTPFLEDIYVVPLEEKRKEAKPLLEGLVVIGLVHELSGQMLKRQLQILQDYVIPIESKPPEKLMP
jgi:hypothetical protein